MFVKNWKNLYFSAGLRIATSQKTIIVITTAVRTSCFTVQIYLRAVVTVYNTKIIKIIIIVVISS
jgi:hypothetical protein